MKHFDYQSVATEAGIGPAQLEQIIERVRRDFPADDMLCELHVLRACRAIRDESVTIEQVLAAPSPAQELGRA